MSNKPFLEESVGTETPCSIHNLVRDEKITGTKVVLETTDGGKGNDGVYTDMFQGGNVGAGRDLGRRVNVTSTMACKEGDRSALRRSCNCNGAGRVSPGSEGVELGNVSEVLKRVKSRSSDDSQSNGLWTNQRCSITLQLTAKVVG
jgi:hypothetical protein